MRLFIALALLCAPSPALAYSDHLVFGRPAYDPDPTVEQGGGGGRFFTGSMVDNYTCEVCHRGAEAEPEGFEVTGWPEATYTPGG